MLENMNDYASVIAILFFLAVSLGFAIYIINLKRIESNIKKEVKYYDYDKRK